MGTLRAATISVLLASGLCVGAVNEPQKVKRERLCFVDEGSQDPSFLAFRNSLRDIVEKKDSSGLINVLADDIRSDIYGERGIPAFVKNYRLTDPDSEIWRDLGRILNLGGSFIEPTVFCAPFVRCPGPQGIDSELFVVVLGERVPAYASPSTASQVVEWLSCDVLPYEGDDLPRRPLEPSGWMSVYLGQRWAFVEEERTREVGDWYFHATKIDGRWLLTTILAG